MKIFKVVEFFNDYGRTVKYYNFHSAENAYNFFMNAGTKFYNKGFSNGKELVVDEEDAINRVDVENKNFDEIIDKIVVEKEEDTPYWKKRYRITVEEMEFQDE